MYLSGVLLFFVYGLAFFLLGFSILLYPKKDSSFKLASGLFLIAGFGLTHGINEWIDMFLLLWKSELLLTVRAVILPVSFLFLAWFAVKTIAETNSRYSPLKALPFALAAVWAVLTFLSGRKLLMGEVLARYLIGAPGIFLTAYALIIKLKEFEGAQLPGVKVNLRLSALAFFLYGVFSSLIVPEADFFPASLFNNRVFLEAVGTPVQFFRTLCAFIITYGMVLTLSVFEYETKIKIRESEELFRSIFENAMDGILMVDAETKRFYTGNKMICEMLGYSPEECRALSVADIHPGEDLPHVINVFEKHARGEMTLANEVPVKRKDGSVFFADINTSVITLRGRRYLIGIFRDMTTRKEAEEKKQAPHGTTRFLAVHRLGDKLEPRPARYLADTPELYSKPAES